MNHPSFGWSHYLSFYTTRIDKTIVEMAKSVGSKAESKRNCQKSQSIPLDQVSPAVLTATRDVAYMLEQLCICPGPEDVLKAVLDRAEHLEEQASGITLFED